MACVVVTLEQAAAGSGLVHFLVLSGANPAVFMCLSPTHTHTILVGQRLFVRQECAMS